MVLENIMNLVVAIVIHMPAQMPTPTPTPEPAVSEHAGLMVYSYRLSDQGDVGSNDVGVAP